MYRNGLRLAYSVERDHHMKRRSAVKGRVYPKAATCFQCRTRFDGEDARQIVHNDGACDACAGVLDARLEPPKHREEEQRHA